MGVTLCCRQRQLSCVDADDAVTLALSARNGAFSIFFCANLGVGTGALVPSVSPIE